MKPSISLFRADAALRSAGAFLARLGPQLRRFRRDQGGQIAIIFAISALTLVTAVGAGVDLSRAFIARQQLSHAATLTCQYSARPSVVSVAYSNGEGTTTYVSQVNQQAVKYVSSQGSNLTQTNGAPFNWGGFGQPSSVNMRASVPTYFMGLAGVQAIPVSTTVSCASGAPQANDTQPSIVVNEGFENSACDGTCWSTFAPNGAGGLHAAGISSTPQNTPTPNYGYTGQSGVQWIITGYCLEVDSVGVIKSNSADGSNHSAELDCDNGSGTAGNSSISTRSFLTAGSYELRYYYSGRIPYPNYSPMYVCGTTDNHTSGSDLGWASSDKNGWANDTSASGGQLRTNQINVYLDPDTSSNVTPPTHTTMDGAQTLAGADLIDECVYSDNYIQRSVKINVTTAGYYWLSFAADGGNDSFGGQIDDIRLCHNTCPVVGNLDNFPSAWANKALFEDTFENPSRTNPGNGIDVSDTLFQSYGTSGSGSGWPSQATSGWTLSGINQVNYLLKSSFQGVQSLELDTNGSNSNRSMTRPFFLDPGYYQVDYNYVSDALIQYAGANSTFCTNPATNPGFIPNPYGPNPFPATHRITGASLNVPVDSNWIAVMMTNSQLTSHPNITSAFNAAPTYTNPDDTQSNTPTVAPDSFNSSTYTSNSGRNNPVLDQCAFSNVWTHRTTYVQITKPGQYWLTLSAGGTADGVGGAVDDVKLTALNSLYGSAPSFYVTIPTAGPAPGSSYSPAANAGYTIIADPLAP